MRKARKQSVRDIILEELLPLQSVVRAGSNENARMTDRMSDSIDKFFQIIKYLVCRNEKKKTKKKTSASH